MTTCRLTFIGTATTLLELGPFRVLTDPNFLHKGQRAYVGKGLTAKRLTEPAMDPRDLPPLDAVVLSHLHGDHWDRVARRHLDPDVPVLTTPSAARRLRALHGRRHALGLHTWESTSLTRDGHTLRVTALPGRHAPGIAQALLPPVMGSLLEVGPTDASTPPERIYLSGDTLVVDELGEIARRHPDIDTAVLHLGGGTLPGGLVVTMDGEAGAELFELLGPGRAVPVHYGDYALFKSPLQDFLDAMSRRGLLERVDAVARGATVDVGRTPTGGS